MTTPLILIGGIIALGVIYVLLPEAAYTFFRYCHTKVLNCPETGELAEVNIDALRAANFYFDKPVLRVKNCTLWPKRKGCGEGCLRQ